MQSQDFIYKTGDNGEPILASVHWSQESSYGSEQSKPIGMIVTAPISCSGDNTYYYIALVLHAGGYMVGSKDSTPKSQITYLANLNFVVVLANYRLCPQVSARDGAFADTWSATAWARHKLPALLKESHGVVADGSRLVAMGYSAGGTLAMYLATLDNPPKAIAPFYPSLYVSEPTNTAQKPYAGFGAMPDYDPTSANEDAVYNRPSGEQVSDFPFAPPGTPPKPRNIWQFSTLKNGSFMSSIQPDGDYKAIDPCVQFASKGKQWPPTMFVQGSVDDAPGSGLAYVQRAVEDLRKAGAKKVEAEFVEGAPHMFDMFPGNEVGETGKGAQVKKALDFLRAEV